jgi:predicted transcriptional regulator of viral defense system
MPKVPPNALPDILLSRGQHAFTLVEAKSMLQRNDDAVRKGLERLTRSGQIFSPGRSYYVVIPPEFRSWGTVPASHFIDGLMNALDRRYYVALLSAAELHGAAHQAPQVFQVMVDRHLKDRDFGRTRLRFYTSRHVSDATVERRNVPTGQIRLSPRELTAIDLVEHPDASGGLNNIATVLAELAPLESKTLAGLAVARARSTVRRLGWLLEFLDADVELKALRKLAEPNTGSPTDLRSGAPRRGPIDVRWNVRINTDVQPDL